MGLQRSKENKEDLDFMDDQGRAQNNKNQKLMTKLITCIADTNCQVDGKNWFQRINNFALNHNVDCSKGLWRGGPM